MAAIIGGVDLATLGFTVRRREGDLLAALDAPPMRAAGDGWGEGPSGAPGVVTGRDLVLIGRLEAASAFALEAAKDALLRICTGGATGPTTALVPIALSLASGTSGRRWMGYLTAKSDWQRRDPTGIQPTADVTLRFRIPDPRAEATTLSTLTLGTTVQRTAVGELQVAPLFVFDGGSWTSRTLIYVDGADVPIASLTIRKPSGSAGAGQTIEIDGAAESIVQVNGGTRTPQNGWLAVGDGDFLVLDPAHAVGGTPPGFVLSAGTGAASWRNRFR